MTNKSASGVLNSDMTAVFTNNRAADIPTGLTDVIGKLWWIIPVAAIVTIASIYIKHHMADKHSKG